MNDLSRVSVPFHDNTLYLLDRDGEPYTPMKPIVEGMGLNWDSQNDKLKANISRWGIAMIAIPSSGGKQETVCMPLKKLLGWLMSIQPSRVKAGIREKVLAYQNECDDVLWNYWSKGHVLPPSPAPDREAIRDEVRRILAENPSDPYVPNFADGIMCLSDLARVAAEECDLETCRRIDLILSEIRRVLETGLSGKTGKSRPGPDRRACSGAEVDGMRLPQLYFGGIPERVPVVNRDTGGEPAVIHTTVGLSGGKYRGEWNRQPWQERGVQGVFLATFQTGPVASVGQMEDLDGLRFRIHNPVFGNPEPFVEGPFHPAVGHSRSRRQDLDQQIRNALDVLLGDDRGMGLRDEDQVRLRHLEGILGKDHVAGGWKNFPERIFEEKNINDTDKIFQYFLMAGCGRRGHEQLSVNDLVAIGSPFRERHEFLVGPFLERSCLHRNLLDRISHVTIIPRSGGGSNSPLIGRERDEKRRALDVGGPGRLSKASPLPAFFPAPPSLAPSARDPGTLEVPGRIAGLRPGASVGVGRVPPRYRGGSSSLPVWGGRGSAPAPDFVLGHHAPWRMSLKTRTGAVGRCRTIEKSGFSVRPHFVGQPSYTVA